MGNAQVNQPLDPHKLLQPMFVAGAQVTVCEWLGNGWGDNMVRSVVAVGCPM